MHRCREDLEWSGAASRAPPCTVGYLAGAVPTLETACCQAAEAQSQGLADALTGSDRQAERQRAPVKPELMGAAGASNAPCTVLVSSIASGNLKSFCLLHILQFVQACNVCACLKNSHGDETALSKGSGHGHTHVEHTSVSSGDACLLKAACIYD